MSEDRILDELSAWGTKLAEEKILAEQLLKTLPDLENQDTASE